MSLRRFLVLAIGITPPLCAQLGSSGGGSTATRVQQLPLSGRTQGSSVGIGQSTAGAAGTGSVNTLNSTLQVQGDLQGSVPGNDPVTQQPLSLTLAQAVKRGLQFNLSALVSNNAQRAANAERLGARAQLLPDINGDAREVVQQIDLAASGLRFPSISLVPGQPGFNFPSIVGPFNYFDVRASVSQSVADLTRLHNYRSSKESARAAGMTVLDSRELIVLAVTGTYLQVIAAQSRVDTARAQIATAQVTYTQAVDRNKSGLNARIDVNRSLVELQTQQQRLNSLLNDLAKQKLSFARLIGLPLSQSISLTDAQPFDPTETVSGLDEMIRLAVNPAQSHGTFSVTGNLHVPIFRSGRIKADVEQASAVLAQRRAELEDIRGRAEQDVRNAQLDVNTASEQIRLAESNRRLAAETLEQAKDRFTAGIADTVELVQAQESLATAEQDYISAMYSYQLARAGLARAIGAAEKSIHP